MEACVRRVSIPVEGMAAVSGQRTVLLVMADGGFRGAAGRALGQAGYRVLTAAHSGHAFLASLRGPRIDVLIAGLDMDDVSGPALAGRLRRHHPDLQAIFIADAGTATGDGVLVRPFTIEDLLGRLQRGTDVGPVV